MAVIWLFFFTYVQQENLLEIFTRIPSLVLICKVLAIGLPARLCSGGILVYGFLLFCFGFIGFVFSIADTARSFLYLETMNT